MPDRSDIQTAVHVNHGIAFAELEGLRRGAEYMANNGVPISVARRVLLHPHLRRQYDWR